jgi:DNA-binding GntR family transcriptional regulator
METPPRFLTKRELVLGAIRRDILNGTLTPGSQLQQDEVAARLGVSATPVREAFGALQAEGFLENIPHRGVFVCNPSYDDLIDIYELRALVEGLALRRAVTRSKDTARKLLRITARAEQELGSQNIERIRRTINEFHQLIIELAGSQMFTEVLEKLVGRSLFFLPFDLGHMQLVLGEHAAIAEAVEQGEIDRAVELLGNHHRRHAERLRKMREEPSAAVPDLKARQTA